MPIAVDLTGETIPTNCRVTVLKLVVCSYFRKALLLPYALSGFDPQVKCAELKLYYAYSPVNVVCWKRAICLEFIGKVSIPDTNQRLSSFFGVRQL